MFMRNSILVVRMHIVPLTIKQAIYVLGGGIVIIVARYVFIPIIFFPIAFVIAAFAAALAFLKIGDIPFPIIVKNGFFYYMHPHVYIWRKEDAKKAAAQKPVRVSDVTVNATPKLSESKLSDLAWSLNIKDKLREPQEEESISQTQF